jgi:uncharacterized protein (TIGR03435 family)
MKLRSSLIIVAAQLAFASQCSAQPDAPAQEAVFEVVSVKSHPGPIDFSADPAVHGSLVTATAMSLLNLIEDAYELRRDQISGGPAWIRTERFDLAARVSGGRPVTGNDLRRMLRGLLADRFHLRVHRETISTPVYELVIDKGGPKINESPLDATAKSIVNATDTGLHMEVVKGKIAGLVQQLSSSAGRPVVDKTSLTGYYSYTLDWFPANLIPSEDSQVASMFKALQEQLGLKLQSGKGSAETLVIDEAQKPEAN